jgi:hypothetical protein
VNSLTPADLARVAAYADDALPPDERARFESELASNSALREELELQATLDASLNRLFEYSEAETQAQGPAGDLPLVAPATPVAGRAAIPPQARRSPFLRYFALAASLLIVAAAGWYFVRPDPHLIPPEQVWTNIQNVNFVPSWKCENEKVFRDYLNVKLGESFAIDESESLKVVGWGYGVDYKFYPLSKSTLTLINKVGDTHAIVLIDKVENERNLTVPASTGLHLYKKRVGNLVLYEMSPLPEPHVLPNVRI